MANETGRHRGSLNAMVDGQKYQCVPLPWSVHMGESRVACRVSEASSKTNDQFFLPGPFRPSYPIHGGLRGRFDLNIHYSIAADAASEMLKDNLLSQ